MENEKLKIWLGFIKFFLGTFLIGFISLIVDTGFENREIEVKESEQVGKYVEIALREDVGLRKRFAEYFKTVSISDKYRERWIEYYNLVSLEFDSLESQANVLQSVIDSLESVKISLNETIESNPIRKDSLVQINDKVIELEQKKSNLQAKLNVPRKQVP